MDFDTTYLISSSGKQIIKKGEKNACNSIVIVINKVTDKTGKYQGMITDKKQKVHQINVDASNSSMNFNKYTEKSYTELAAISATNSVGTTKVDINTSDYNKSKTQFVSIANDNTNMLSNLKAKAEYTALTISVNKNDIDASVITMNKEYLIRCSDVYDDCDGRYLLSKKREVYLREDENFIGNIMLTLRKVSSPNTISKNTKS